MTATYQTTPLTTVVILRPSVLLEKEEPANAQALEDDAHRAMYRAAEIEAGLRKR